MTGVGHASLQMAHTPPTHADFIFRQLGILQVLKLYIVAGRLTITEPLTPHCKMISGLTTLVIESEFCTTSMAVGVSCHHVRPRAE